ncbi:glycosyltransferase family protein [Anditalea andensis]|uniref:Glycosyl transferase family 2 n=1 Tax=Anditalea andensis TaxID=1048983 RepID=A0A074KT16_9BACT|nr:hypothetical protein [Anditalea andensis]KEO72059.1 hypothetical protein EL17_19290 [Anditalea andensis]
MAEIKLITCAGVEHDLALLPHFIAYYKALGIHTKNMYFILQASESDSHEMKKAQAILHQDGITAAEIWIAPYTSATMWEKRREIQLCVANKEDWVISADVDEFHEFPDKLSVFLSYCDKKEINCVQGVFIDRLTSDGSLAAIKASPPLWEQFPVQADVICTIRQVEENGWENGTVNIMACKGDLLPERGGHFPLNHGSPIKYIFGSRQLAKFNGIKAATTRFQIPLRVHHFKWNQALLQSLQKRLATAGVSTHGQSYGNLLLQHLGEDQRIQIEKMPIRKSGTLDKLPWRTQLALLKLRNDSSSLYRKILSKIR